MDSYKEKSTLKKWLCSQEEFSGFTAVSPSVRTKKVGPLPVASCNECRQPSDQLRKSFPRSRLVSYSLVIQPSRPCLAPLYSRPHSPIRFSQPERPWHKNSGVRSAPTSFPGSLILPSLGAPWGGKMRDTGNEVGSALRFSCQGRAVSIMSKINKTILANINVKEFLRDRHDFVSSIHVKSLARIEYFLSVYL